mmetsp:Transcript_15090/g.33192  ORF Transcript_15090/g.33192 Transcript_15090/m.33192 type:complete len:105 (-) Transcript_15090:126-440(-)
MPAALAFFPAQDALVFMAGFIFATCAFVVLQLGSSGSPLYKKIVEAQRTPAYQDLHDTKKAEEVDSDAFCAPWMQSSLDRREGMALLEHYGVFGASAGAWTRSR